MHSHRVYVVTSVERSHDIHSIDFDVHIVNVYDSKIFTVDSLIEGLKGKLKGQMYRVSRRGNNGYIDVVDDDDEVIKSYFIISKIAMLAN